MSDFVIITPEGGLGVLQIEPTVDLDLETNEYASTISINVRGLSVRNLNSMTWSIGSPVVKQMGMTITGISVPINLPPGSKIRRAEADDLKQLLQ